MRFFSFLLSLFFLINFSNAQTFTIKEDTLSKKVHPDEFENYISNYAVNITNESKTLRWTQKTYFKGSLWSKSQVCDNNLCYTDKILTKTLVIKPGDSTLLKILFRPNGQDTSGYYTITVQVDSTFVIDDEAHFFFNGATSSTRKIDAIESVKIYPNPAVDYIQLNSKDLIKGIKIYNGRGSIVKSINDYNKGLITVKDLPSGTYFMMFTFYNGTLGVSKLIKT